MGCAGKIPTRTSGGGLQAIMRATLQRMDARLQCSVALWLCTPRRVNEAYRKVGR